MSHLTVAWRKQKIRVLLRESPCTVAEISEALDEPRSTVARTLDKMTGEVERWEGYPGTFLYRFKR